MQLQSFDLRPTLTAAEVIELPLRIAGELEKPTVSAVLDRLGGLEAGR
jgi:predicted ABC-type transport system involved in lysophospholipase L1 biosynthesis ATPase subunit